MNKHAPTLPLTQNLRWFYLFSLLIGLLTAATSLLGVFAADAVYVTEEIAQSFVANDVINLFIGLPILLLAMWLAWRGPFNWPALLAGSAVLWALQLYGLFVRCLFQRTFCVVPDHCNFERIHNHRACGCC